MARGATRGDVLRCRALFRFLWSFYVWRRAGLGPDAAAAQAAAGAEVALPPAVVVHGRRGPNSSLNGVYVRDDSWRGPIGPCYKRRGATGQQAIFLYFEGEWRMGPSPEEGSVWAYAHSGASSPLQIDTPWQVWDGQRVVEDTELQVSDSSMIPSVLFLSFNGEGVPVPIRALQGMMLQQPGLWDGRPYYRHRAWEELYLLCSVPEGRWRLGPLPIGDAPRIHRPLLFTVSAASLPQDIVESWHVPLNETNHLTLNEGTVRLTTSSGLGVPAVPRHRHPRHLLVEGIAAAEGAANGVYRRAPELLNQRPVYHKTDALRAASLWFAGGDWRVGPSIEGGRAWAYALSTVFSPLEIDASWQQHDGPIEEAARLADAGEAIPGTVFVAGDKFAQQQRLCDARPVYRREPRQPGGGDVFLFFRAHEGEWWLGPAVGGTECYARATGSKLQVVPQAGELRWRRAADEELLSSAGRSAAPAPPGELNLISGGGGWEEPRAIIGTEEDSMVGLPRWFFGLAVVTVATAAAMCGACFGTHNLHRDGVWWATGAWSSAATRTVEVHGVIQRGPESCLSPQKPGVAKRSALRSRAPSLACVVCLEAPRQILLLPCRHVCCCKACADRLERCPVCRAWKTAFTKVFL
uniref:RING-type domain-containing protein n=1 Tax=Alexandrium monilatum TaxID=311494 RepID=A0A7S4SDA9_9DINO